MTLYSMNKISFTSVLPLFARCALIFVRIITGADWLGWRVGDPRPGPVKIWAA